MTFNEHLNRLFISHSQTNNLIGIFLQHYFNYKHVVTNCVLTFTYYNALLMTTYILVSNIFHMINMSGDMNLQISLCKFI